MTKEQKTINRILKIAHKFWPDPDNVHNTVHIYNPNLPEPGDIGVGLIRTLTHNKYEMLGDSIHCGDTLEEALSSLLEELGKKLARSKVVAQCPQCNCDIYKDPYFKLELKNDNE
jgi:hypothetical protein